MAILISLYKLCFEEILMTWENNCYLLLNLKAGYKTIQKYLSKTYTKNFYFKIPYECIGKKNIRSYYFIYHIHINIKILQGLLLSINYRELCFHS